MLEELLVLALNGLLSAYKHVRYVNCDQQTSI